MYNRTKKVEKSKFFKLFVLLKVKYRPNTERQISVAKTSSGGFVPSAIGGLNKIMKM